MIYYLDLLGTLAFAIGGAYKAKMKKLNIFGVTLLGTITAVGGGTVRDFILGRTPLFYLQDQNYLIICILASILTYFLPDFIKKTYSIFRFTDSIGLATFSIIGVSIAIEVISTNNILLSFMGSLLLGTLTAVGGGIIRDSIVGDVPYALKSGSNYISSAFTGSLIYFMIIPYNAMLAIIVSITMTLILREIVSPYGLYPKIRKNGFNNKKNTLN